MKKLLAVLLCIIMLFAFSACSGDEPGAESVDTSAESSEDAPVTIRIGTYNIANGRNVAHDFQILADDIKEADCDIIGIQEVDVNCNRSKNQDTPKILAELSGYEYYAFFRCIDYDGGQYGTCILSKYPIIETSDVELNDGSEVERRVLACAKIDLGGTVINYYNTHLTVHRDDIRVNDELPIIASALAGVERCILTGDFNVDGFDEFELLAPLATTNNDDHPFTTYPGDGDAARMIDNILFSEEFTLIEESIAMRENNHSDHYLFYADYEIVG